MVGRGAASVLDVAGLRQSGPDQVLMTKARFPNPVHDRTWRRESDFADAVYSAMTAASLLPTQPNSTAVVLREVEGLHGRVDLMAASVPDEPSVPREVAAVMREPAAARLVLALHAKQPKSVEQLARDVGLARETVARWLRRMSDVGLVTLIEQRGFVLGPAYEFPRAEIWSFELKLRDWPRALYQATRYRAFSHRSFVLMPDSSIGPALRREARFRLAGVGLASFDLVTGFTMHVKPRRLFPRSSYLFALASAKALVASA